MAEAKTMPTPEGWELPTYAIGEVVWHDCQQYEVIGVAIDKQADSWRYIVNRYPEAAHMANPETLSLLEWQAGCERCECVAKTGNAGWHSTTLTSRFASDVHH